MAVSDLPPPINIGPLARGGGLPITFVTTQMDGVTPYPLTAAGTRILLLVKTFPTDADSAALLSYDSNVAGQIVITNAAQGLFSVIRQPGDLASLTNFPNLVTRYYAVKLFPAEVIGAWGTWTVQDAGVAAT